MNGGVLALMIAGFVAFGAGAYLASSGDRMIGIVMMAVGLIFQVLTLRQMKLARHAQAQNHTTQKDESDAG